MPYLFLIGPEVTIFTLKPNTYHITQYIPSTKMSNAVLLQI